MYSYQPTITFSLNFERTPLELEMDTHRPRPPPSVGHHVGKLSWEKEYPDGYRTHRQKWANPKPSELNDKTRELI